MKKVLFIFLLLSFSPGFAQNLNEIEKYLIEIVNLDRNETGLSSFVIDPLISEAAKIQADYLSTINTIKEVSHSNPILKYRSATDRIRKVSNLKYDLSSENITAFFYNASKTSLEIAEQIHSNFMNSKYHRINLLREVKYKDITYPSYYGHCIIHNRKLNYIIAVQMFPVLNFN